MIVDYVNDEGASVPAGQPGNVVVTRLHPGPMPLIRYANGDSAVAVTGHRCSCGRGFEVMEGIEGRSGDVVLTPGGNRLIVHFFTGIIEHFKDIEIFQVIQEEKDRLVVRVVPGVGFETGTTAKIRDRLRERGLTDMRIDVETTPDIPTPKSTKHRFVLSKIGSSPPPSVGRSTKVDR